MRITKVSVYSCKQPLKNPFTHASSGLINHLDGVYVKLDTCEGASGIGEVRGNCSYFTGDTTGAVIATIVRTIAPAMLGKDPCNLNVLHDAIEGCVVGNKGAKAACDAAAYDLAAKIAGVPVYVLLGGKRHDVVMSEENIPFMPVSAAEKMAEGYLAGGCEFIKMRVGSASFADDLARVSAVWQVIWRHGLADRVVFSCDANQAWNTGDAIRYINRLAEHGITIVEQPTRFDSIYRMLELKKRIPVKLFGDEWAATVEDVTRLIELGAVDGIHIKLIKCGGIQNALRIIHLAEAHGIEYMIGGMDEGMLAVAAAVQLAAVSRTNLFEMHGHMRIGKDPTSGLNARGSVVAIPDGPGLGVSVDMSMLRLEYESTIT